MIPAVIAITIHPVNPGFFMMLFNLQRIEYNPDRKISYIRRRPKA